MNIDKYIETSYTMKNTSDGGSIAYHFDDVVLIKYEYHTEYGIARINEEKIAQAANEKNRQGVYTPAHLAIKREIKNDISICWVLQERAKGKSFNYYCYNKETEKQIAAQQILANAPISHYEKFIKDVIELFNFGLELKPKNLYYDENNGFTIIDLIGLKDKLFDYNSLKDIISLINMTQGIYNCSGISYYDDLATKEEKEISKQLFYKIKQKMLNAIAKNIPNFEQYRRWILRTMSPDFLAYLNDNEKSIEDLTLNNEEEEQFNKMIQEIVDDCLNKIISGKCKAWEISTNEIRIGLNKLEIGRAHV